MRLSEAILAGSALVPEMKCVQLSGCALGMALLSVGRPIWDEVIKSSNYDGLVKEWPWITRVVPHPCKCYRCSFMEDREVVRDIIWKIFDTHIASDSTYAGGWTLEQLCDWIESVDPTPKTLPSGETESSGLGTREVSPVLETVETKS